MSLIVLTAAAHSPGTTTTALGLALAWPDPVLLVDGDRQPSQSVLAGFLQGADPRGHGLTGVLQAHRERRPIEACLGPLSLPLPTDGPPRAFLPGFAHPGMVGLFAPVWPELVAGLAGAGTDVLLDAGRIGVDGLPPAMASQADAVAVVTRTSLVDLVALRLYLPLVVEAAGPSRVGLILVGEARPYSAEEIAQQFGAEVWGCVAWSPTEAAVLSDGAAPGRRFSDGGYSRSLARIAGELVNRCEKARRRIGAPR